MDGVKKVVVMHLTIRLPLRDRTVSSLHSHAAESEGSLLLKEAIFFIFIFD